MIETISYRWVLHKHRHQAYSIAVYLLNDNSQAEDIVQEAFMRLWEQRSHIRIGTAKSWLFKVIRNLCLDYLKKSKPDYLGDNSELEALSGIDNKTPEKHFNMSVEIKQIQNALMKLKEPGKSLLIMREIEQMNYQEISELLELSPSQVKVYLHRARTRLRQIMSELHE